MNSLHHVTTGFNIFLIKIKSPSAKLMSDMILS